MRDDEHTEEPGGILNIGDAARLLGVTAQTVKRWARTGHLPSLPRPNNGWWRFYEVDVRALMQPRKTDQ